MPRFVANLTMLFTEVPFLDRFARARQAGFEFVEYLFPYPYEAADLKRRLDELNYPGYVGLEYVPSPDTAGSLGWLRDYGFKA